MATNKLTPKRGIFLNIILAVSVVSTIYSLFTLAQTPSIPAVLNLPSSILSLFPVTKVMGLIFSIISLIGLYMWKKWGIYVVIAQVIFSLISMSVGYYAIFSNNPNLMGTRTGAAMIYGALGGYIGMLIWPALLLWAVKRKYSYFK